MVCCSLEMRLWIINLRRCTRNEAGRERSDLIRNFQKLIDSLIRCVRKCTIIERHSISSIVVLCRPDDLITFDHSSITRARFAVPSRTWAPRGNAFDQTKPLVVHRRSFCSSKTSCSSGTCCIALTG